MDVRMRLRNLSNPLPRDRGAFHVLEHPFLGLTH